MKKSTILLTLILITLMVVTIGCANTKKEKTNLPQINSQEDLAALVDKVYEGIEIEMPNVQTQTIDLTDADLVKSITGLDNTANLEYIVASEPLMSSQAYSLVLVKVKDGINSDEVAKNMNEKIDARKWICVSAEKVYSTSSGNVVCLVMSSEEIAKPIFENFKTLAGNVGQVYEKGESENAMPLEENAAPLDENSSTQEDSAATEQTTPIISL